MPIVAIAALEIRRQGNQGGSPLRDWAENLLGERRLREEGVFHPGPIRAKWTQHLSGQRDWQYDLWDILMFQAWLDEHKPAAFR